MLFSLPFCQSDYNNRSSKMNYFIYFTSKRLEFDQDAPTTTGITTTFSCSFLFHFVKAIRVRSRCSYHNRYHHHCHCLFFQVLVNFLAFLCEYPTISGCCHFNNDDNLTPSVSSLFFFYVWSFDPRLISKPNYYMLAGVFPWGCIILNIPGSL